MKNLPGNWPHQYFFQDQTFWWKWIEIFENDALNVFHVSNLRWNRNSFRSGRSPFEKNIIKIEKHKIKSKKIK